MAYCCFLENNDCSNPLRTHISFHCFRRLVRLLFKNTNFNVTVTHKQLIQKNKPTFIYFYLFVYVSSIFPNECLFINANAKWNKKVTTNNFSFTQSMTSHSYMLMIAHITRIQLLCVTAKKRHKLDVYAAKIHTKIKCIQFKTLLSRVCLYVYIYAFGIFFFVSVEYSLSYVTERFGIRQHNIW